MGVKRGLLAFPILIALAFATNLTLTWQGSVSLDSTNPVTGVALGTSGSLGASAGNCLYLFDSSMYQLFNLCEPDSTFNGASYDNHLYGFVSSSGYAYIVKEDGSSTLRYSLDTGLNGTIRMLDSGFLVCYTSCAYYTSGGVKVWSTSIGKVINPPAVIGSYVYVPDFLHASLVVLNLVDGAKVNSTIFNSTVYSTASCNNYLAVGTAEGVYLYNASSPNDLQLLWKASYSNNGVKLVFSSDCNYVAALYSDGELRIYDKEGKVSYSKSMGGNSIDWRGDIIAIGFQGTPDHIDLFKVSESTSANSNTGIPAPALLAPLLGGLFRRTKKKLKNK